MRFITGMQSGLTLENTINEIHINWLNKKNYMIISIGAENTCDKIQHPFVLKTLSKVGIDRNVFNLTRSLPKTHG